MDGESGGADIKLWGHDFRNFFATEVKPCDQSGIMEALRCARAVIERTFISTTRGYLGSTSMQVHRGDMVYVVPGCSFTVLLRLVDKCFEVVGECYVEGLMLGEAIHWVEEGICALEMIKLC